MSEKIIKRGGPAWVPPTQRKVLHSVDNDIVTTVRREMLCARNNHQLGLDDEAMENLKAAAKKLNGFIEKGGFQA